ncbi:hypothetical protein RCG23_21195 [Neobacillus sp. PS3-34]|uniref:lipopolysaccharide biosynthesis protein n=1 Tax=Neobacillus sp. PS3-34 TaxID=3070678 RepID=UPI0027E0770F|nr:oligosaccharide flippase family protein [Neobacillus sp. PS3-34]WML50681.1 hypothetical protein RCG23_21195 [Neobacillus sp. PS3-34]
MRTNHSIKNIYMSIFSQVVIILLGFIARKIFLDNLGAAYLGINGLLTNVLSTLVLVEGGIAISIVYNLYKPLAEKNEEKIIALVQLYKKAYFVLAIITLIISLGIYPFLGRLMKEGGNIPYLSIIYFIFVGKSMISYLNAHKWSLINADQRGYILTKVNLVFQVAIMITRIIILVYTKSYVFYMAIELILFIIQNIINGKIVNKRYAYIKTKKRYYIDQSTRNNIVTNVKAMFLHNIGGYLVYGTDNLLISSLISVSTVGLYSNYTMITGQLTGLLNPILSGIGSSVGNLMATESSNKIYSIFKVSYLLNFWIYSLCVIFLFNILEPFISWWLGKQYLLDNLTFIFILINLYLDGSRTSIGTFKNKAGLFVQDKYMPLLEGFINLISSLVLVKQFGLAGIFIGTTISTIATVFWTQPCIVYKNVFKIPVSKYFSTYCFYSILTLLSCYISAEICNIFVPGNSLISLIEKGIICLFVPNIIYVGVFYKTEEFKYIKNILGSIISRLKIRKVVQQNAKG